MPGFRPSSFDMQPVCVNLNIGKLAKMGTLPKEVGERIFLQVDGQVYAWSSPFWGEGCIEFPISPGEHVAAVYVDFFGPEILVYSWSFVLRDR